MGVQTPEQLAQTVLELTQDRVDRQLLLDLVQIVEATTRIDEAHVLGLALESAGNIEACQVVARRMRELMAVCDALMTRRAERQAKDTP